MNTKEPLHRRTILKGIGVTMALPFLEGMIPSLIAQTGSATAAAGSVPHRMVLINLGLGLYAENLFPNAPGRNYEMTPYLEELAVLRDQFTIISGLSHPDVDGGHSATKSILTAAPHPGSSNFQNSVSLDQLVAEQIGHQTRYGYLSLSTGSGSISWSRSGVQIPSHGSPSKLFADLFLDGKPEEVQHQVDRLKRGQSIMDTVMGQAKEMQGKLTARDRDQLDQYFTAVRETEERLVKSENWSKTPKPVVDAEQPNDIDDRADVIGRARLMYDMMHLALQTDSTRTITLSADASGARPPIEGIDDGYHPLSHHGKDPEKISQLTIIELEQMRAFRDFLTNLQKTQEESDSLLDRTMVVLTSNLGNAASHNNRNLPVLFAGGGFNHGQYLAFDRENNTPLCNLYVSMLQRMGLEKDQFASSTGTLTGLEAA